jgi:hypothetical protein
MNKIMQYVTFHIWRFSLSEMHLRFIHLVWNSTLFLLLLNGITLYIYTSLFSHSPVERYLGCFCLLVI